MRNAFHVAALQLFALLILGPAVARAADVDDPGSTEWAAYRDMDGDNLAEKVKELKTQGFRLVGLEMYLEDDALKHAGIWRKDKAETTWAEVHGVEIGEFNKAALKHAEAGMRLIDVAAQLHGDSTLFSGVWVENKSKLGLAFFIDLTDAEYRTVFSKHSKKYRPHDFEAYETPDGIRYAIIWVENKDQKWGLYRHMSSDGLTKRFSGLDNDGYRMIDVERYERDGQTAYAGIWLKNNDRNWIMYRDMSRDVYGERYQQYKSKFRIIDLDFYPTSDGIGVAAIWRNNE